MSSCCSSIPMQERYRYEFRNTISRRDLVANTFKERSQTRLIARAR
jgi:hypothetical protein